MQHIFKFVLIATGLIFSVFVAGQTSQTSKEVKQINLKHADLGLFDNIAGNNAQRLIGNVSAEHDGSMLYCDSAYLYSNNSIDAFGHVHINLNDSLDMFGDRLYYDGNTKIAEFHDNVRMVDKKATLYTDELIYDRKTGIGRYFVWGRIEDSVNVLTSKKGYYYSDIETVYFKDSVVVVNPDYIMRSDTLKYETRTEKVYFIGPSTITGDSSFLYAEKGYYSTQTKEARLSINSFIQNKSNTLSGDSIYNNKEIGLAKAWQNVVMTDTANDVVITGNFALYHKAKQFAYVIDSAQAIFIDEDDSLYLHADTLMMLFDTLEKPTHLLAFYKMKFFKKQVQGLADSLVYNFNDSILTLFKNPVLWFEENQITSNQIDLVTRNQELDSAAFQGNVFLVSQDTVDTRYFNQVSGQNMFAWFVEGEMRKISVRNKSESIYFLWEEDETPIGMNTIRAKDMLIFMKNRQLETITYIEKPVANVTPTHLVNPQDEKLKGFIWKPQWRPMKPSDIFIRTEDSEIAK